MANAWEAIFSQSPVNNGFYNGETLLPVHWDWPKHTWFQARLHQIREHERPLSGKSSSGRVPDDRETQTM